MGKIFCLIGKSGSGKDTLFKRILLDKIPGITPVIPYTTRPKRFDENDGENYVFVSPVRLKQMEEKGEVLEKREYNTTKGLWTYFTVKFQMEKDKDYILIATPAAAGVIAEYYGGDNVHVIMLNIDDGERLIRCVKREQLQSSPDYIEICRRFIADGEDFSDIGDLPNLHYINASLSLEECFNSWKEIYDGVKEG